MIDRSSNGRPGTHTCSFRFGKGFYYSRGLRCDCGRRNSDDRLPRSLITSSSLFRGACSFTLLHDALAFRRKLFNAIADHLCPHLRPSKERGEEPPHRGFSEDESDRDQDSGPRCERANAGE